MKKIFASILSLAFLLSTVGFTSHVYAEEQQAADVEEEEEEEELEFTSAVITALPCAKEAEESGEFDVLSSCPPHAAWEGVKDIYEGTPNIVIFDVTEGELVAEYKGTLSLNGIATLDETTVKQLVDAHEVGHLYLFGLRQLSVQAAQTLCTLRWNLFLLLDQLPSSSAAVIRELRNEVDDTEWASR